MSDIEDKFKDAFEKGWDAAIEAVVQTLDSMQWNTILASNKQFHNARYDFMNNRDTTVEDKP